MGARADRQAKGNGNEEGTYAQKERKRERSLVRSAVLSVHVKHMRLPFLDSERYIRTRA